MDNLPTVIVIPAYDPPAVFHDLVRRLTARDGYLVVVVDDGSHADYQQEFKRLPKSAVLLRHEKNRGKGAALKTALRYIIDHEIACGGCVTADADEKHRLEDILRVAKALRKNGDKIVLGCRSFNRRVPGMIRFGNAVTRWVFRSKTGVKVSDTQSGLRGFPRKYLEALAEIEGMRYEYETNVLLWACEKKIPFFEVPVEIDYTGRKTFIHFHIIRDSFLIYEKLLKFTGVSFTAFLIDYGLVLLFRAVTGGWPERASLVFAVIAARVCSSTYSFTLNRFLVFKNKENVLRRALQFYLLAGILMVSSYVLLDLTTIIMPGPLWLAKPVTDGILFFVNYFVQNKVIFKKKKHLEEKDADQK